MTRNPSTVRNERILRNSYNWRPIATPATELIFRVEQAFASGMDTAGMAKLWGWSEAVCERALHIALERRRL